MRHAKTYRTRNFQQVCPSFRRFEWHVITDTEYDHESGCINLSINCNEKSFLGGKKLTGSYKCPSTYRTESCNLIWGEKPVSEMISNKTCTVSYILY
jgi:hypothetical protein